VAKITASQFNLTAQSPAAAESALDDGWDETPAAENPTHPEPLELTCPACGVIFSSGDAAFCPFDGVRLLRTRKTNEPDLLLGSVLGARYQVKGRLGEGGMGAVYRVEHVTLGKPFAVKVLRSELARDPELSERFIREAQAMARINNPHVIQVTDFGEIGDGRPYFVMELLGGTSLSTLIKSNGVPMQNALCIARHVADALLAAHEAGIVHRDLKPDNVYVEGATADSLQVKVLDFGLAHVVGSSRLTRRGVVFGTPQYMSPEQASGATVDHRADIYALGIVLYEMLAGRVPFEADSYMGVLTKQLYADPAPLPALDSPAATASEIEQVVRRCLQKDPQDRYASMTEVLAALEGLGDRTASGSGVIDPDTRLPARVPAARAWGRSGLSGSSLAILGLAILALVVALGAGLWDRRAPAEPVVPVATPRDGDSRPNAPSRPSVRPVDEGPELPAATAQPPAKPPDRGRKPKATAKPARKGSEAPAQASPSAPPQPPRLGGTDLIDPWSQQ